MKLSTYFSSLPTLLHLLLCFILMPSCNSVSNLSTLIYKNCSNQTFTNASNSHSQTLSTLLQELIAHSSQSNFFKTTEGNEEIALSGLFQCRADISTNDCYNCVNDLSNIFSNSLCAESVAGRAQLQSCYMRYEPDGVVEYSKNYELVHKKCGEPEEHYDGYEEELNEAFGALEEGISSREDGFYSTSYKSVQAMAQCEGDFGSCDCAECVGNAVQIAKDECGGAGSGEVYLDKCYMTYTWHPYRTSHHDQDKESNNGSGKMTAIVLGGAAALGGGFILLVFLKSCGNKDDE